MILVEVTAVAVAVYWNGGSGGGGGGGGHERTLGKGTACPSHYLQPPQPLLPLCYPEGEAA